MSKPRPYLIIFIVFIFIVLSSLAIFFYFKYKASISSGRVTFSGEGCVVELTSSSEELEVQIIDKGRFENFVRTYLPCEDGKFTVGDPYSQEGPFEFSEIVLDINDSEHGNSVYARDEDGQKIKVHTHQYDLTRGEKAYVLMQFRKEVTKLGNFDELLPLFIASRLHALYKYQYPSEWLDRGDNGKNIRFSVDDIGIEYAFK